MNEIVNYLECQLGCKDYIHRSFNIFNRNNESIFSSHDVRLEGVIWITNFQQGVLLIGDRERTYFLDEQGKQLASLDISIHRISPMAGPNRTFAFYEKNGGLAIGIIDIDQQVVILPTYVSDRLKFPLLKEIDISTIY